jgi:hypothetical protein
MFFLIKTFCVILSLPYLLRVNVGRVHDIMRRDSNKDPATNPQALLAKVLIDQVGLHFF